MKIRPKNTILFAKEGVKFSQNNLRGANWRQQVFNNYRQRLLDQLAKYGNDETYGNWLNEMQSRHSKIYNLAGGKDGNWENTAYQNDLVGQYQHDYKGDRRFGTIRLKNEDNYDFNQGISPNFNSRYVISNPPTRISGDNSTKNFNVDNLYSAITDDRRLLGREGDWDEKNHYTDGSRMPGSVGPFADDNIPLSRVRDRSEEASGTWAGRPGHPEPDRHHHNVRPVEPGNYRCPRSVLPAQCAQSQPFDQRHQRHLAAVGPRLVTACGPELEQAGEHRPLGICQLRRAAGVHRLQLHPGFWLPDVPVRVSSQPHRHGRPAGEERALF